MARAADKQEGYSDFGKGASASWLRVSSPLNISLRDGTGLANKPSGIVIDAVDSAGAVTTYWLWIDSTGQLRTATAEPTDEDGSGSRVGPKAITVSTIGIDPNQAIIAGSTIEVATTITGVAVGDLVLIARSSIDGLTASYTGYQIDAVARITTVDQILVRFRSITNAAITPEPETIRYTWFDLT